ncbi:exonuclease 1 [Achlya hypogyna]|uniref:Exonuclease 1 n=1 Tax=Achlya hypogyna TaxID=1202772 RepID=A0A1V9YDM5_ACHHY|nr:exonuclease 1 [Achlya hypogyna]
MGISNLLPQLKSITTPTNLEAYRGKTVAVDGYCWLHRGVYSCSQELCLGQGSDKYINYFMERVDHLLTCGIIPYIVFDGGYLPMKKLKEEERRSGREKHRTAGLQHLENKNYEAARQCFVKAVDVSPYMAHRVIQSLKKRKVQYVVAPYEADAQMAYLARAGLVDAVISEDSDCLPFGCPTVLFKMDNTGHVDEIRLADLAKNKALSFVGFNDDMFLDMCILSGCDYVASIPGLGVKKSHGLLQRYGTWQKVVRALRLEGKLAITKSYEADVTQARLTFRHQRVYDPRTKTLVTLTEMAPTKNATDFLGPEISNDVAQLIAEGDLDPISMDRFPTTPVKATPPPRPAKLTPTPPVVPKPVATLVMPDANKENAFTRMLSAAGTSLIKRSAMKRKLPFSDANVSKWMYKKPTPPPMATEPAKSSRFFASKPVVRQPLAPVPAIDDNEPTPVDATPPTTAPVAPPPLSPKKLTPPRTLFDHFRFQGKV